MYSSRNFVNRSQTSVRISSKATILNVCSSRERSSRRTCRDISGLRLVFVLLDHTGDITSLTQSLETFIVKQGLDNMLKNRDTIKQVGHPWSECSFTSTLFRTLKATSSNYSISIDSFPISFAMHFITIRDFSPLVIKVTEKFTSSSTCLRSSHFSFSKNHQWYFCLSTWYASPCYARVIQLLVSIIVRRGLFSSSSATRTTMAESRCPELLAQYCDILLRRGTLTHKKYSSEEIEAKIKDVVRSKL